MWETTQWNSEVPAMEESTEVLSEVLFHVLFLGGHVLVPWQAVNRRSRRNVTHFDQALQ